MRSIYIIMFSLASLTACQHQQVMTNDVVKKPVSSNVVSQTEKVDQGSKKVSFHTSADFKTSPSGQKFNADSSLQKSGRSKFLQVKTNDKRIVINISDPVSRKLSAKTLPGIKWIEQRSDERTILKIDFENDLITYANTDRYFTNGIAVTLQAAWLAKSRFQKLMIPYKRNSFASSEINFVQDMYTPTSTIVTPTLHNDRPYASILYLGFRNTVADPQPGLKITSQLKLGYIGPYSLGSSLQMLVHNVFPTNDKPVGWDTQINSDLILDYYARVQKALVNNTNFTLLAGMDAETGTLYNNAGAGFQLMAGRYEPVFGINNTETQPELEYYLSAKTDISFVAYNALLQGGMFNHNNVFTLSGKEIQRVVGSASAGIHIRYKSIGIEFAQHYLSPEYKGGFWHKWGRISLVFRIK